MAQAEEYYQIYPGHYRLGRLYPAGTIVILPRGEKPHRSWKRVNPTPHAVRMIPLTTKPVVQEEIRAHDPNAPVAVSELAAEARKREDEALDRAAGIGPESDAPLYEDMTVAELRDYAATLDIAVPNRINKADLIELIKEG